MSGKNRKKCCKEDISRALNVWERFMTAKRLSCNDCDSGHSGESSSSLNSFLRDNTTRPHVNFNRPFILVTHLIVDVLLPPFGRDVSREVVWELHVSPLCLAVRLSSNFCLFTLRHPVETLTLIKLLLFYVSHTSHTRSLPMICINSSETSIGLHSPACSRLAQITKSILKCPFLLMSMHSLFATRLIQQSQQQQQQSMRANVRSNFRYQLY